MIRPYAALVALLTILGLAAGARADTFLFATMTHSQETVRGPFLTSSGAPRPESFGTTEFVLNDARTALTFTSTIFNIDITGAQTADTNDDLLNAHIHAPAPPGSNAGVVWGFLGAPDNDIAPNDLVVTPFASGVGGTISSKWDLNEGNGTNPLTNTLTAQLPNLLGGLAYINYHTRQFGGGEIRGQIIPEPSSLVLSGLGLAALVGLRRRAGSRSAETR